MKLEKVQSKIEQATAVLHMLQNDIVNPEGACIESMQVDTIQMIIDNLESVKYILKDI